MEKPCNPTSTHIEVHYRSWRVPVEGLQRLLDSARLQQRRHAWCHVDDLKLWRFTCRSN
jgi:hypothetical protein